MTVMPKTKFIDTYGARFTVDELQNSEAGVIVYYTKESTGQQYNCLLEAFTERFKYVNND